MKHKLLVLLLCSCIAVFAQKRPNIVLILADDIGFEEFGVYKVKKNKPSNTPNIDALAEQGVAFKTAYAQSICGPSRSMIYSGNYAMNTGAYDNKLAYKPGMKRINKDLDRLPNFVKVLHDAGYTTLVSGKWHNPAGGTLGVHNELLGVDEYMVYNSQPSSVKKLTGIDLKPDENWETAAISKQPILSRYWKPQYVKNGKLLETTMKDYGPDLLSDYVCDFIKRKAKSDQPFLAFYPMVLAHSSHCVTPIDVKNGDKPSNVHERMADPKGKRYFLNQVAYADQLVQKIWNTIQEQGIADETIFIFTSDNGTTASAKSKGVEYGVHIPFVVTGAGIKQRGMTDELTDFTDVLPTLAAFAETKVPSKYNVDGVNIKPFLTGKSNETKPVIYAQPGVSSIVRTKDYLLEAVSPVYGYPKGRFYKTNNSYDGRKYENITHDEKYTVQRTQFEKYLDKFHNLSPVSFDDPIWEKPNLKRAYKHFNNPKRKKSHLSLPVNYKFYDPSF